MLHLYLVWPDATPTFGTFVLSSVISFVVVHIIIALAIGPIDDTDDMEGFQMITRYFQNMASATWRLGQPRDRELYDAMKVLLIDAGLTFFFALIGRDRETHLPQHGSVQDVALLPAEAQVEVRILMSSTIVRECDDLSFQSLPPRIPDRMDEVDWAGTKV